MGMYEHMALPMAACERALAAASLPCGHVFGLEGPPRLQQVLVSLTAELSGLPEGGLDLLFLLRITWRPQGRQEPHILPLCVPAQGYIDARPQQGPGGREVEVQEPRVFLEGCALCECGMQVRSRW